VLTPALRVVPDQPLAPLILGQPSASPEPEPAIDAVPEAPLALDAEWEDEIWQEPEPPLAELALGAEEAELISQTEAPADPEDAAWVQVDPDWPDEEELAAVIPLDAAARVATAPAAPAAAADAEAAKAKPSAADADDDLAPTLFDKDGNPLTVLDEDALHDIVRQLIREELQGALGERITRNVRKLVRAEINRALTARALD
jgi:hypothetical protein